jgi:hypothetical protein
MLQKPRLQRSATHHQPVPLQQQKRWQALPAAELRTRAQHSPRLQEVGQDGGEQGTAATSAAAAAAASTGQSRNFHALRHPTVSLKRQTALRNKKQVSPLGHLRTEIQSRAMCTSAEKQNAR